MLIIGLDVGSVRRSGGFSWASAKEDISGSNDPADLARHLMAALDNDQPVALAVECPLTVPVPDVTGEEWRELGRARRGERDRSWSAGAGTGALATGLVELAWLCRFMATQRSIPTRTTTQLATFKAGQADFLIVEAMVTADGKPIPFDGLQDHADAAAAAKRLAELLDDEGIEPDVQCAPHAALNLAASACLHAGLDIDPAELRNEIPVAKVRPR